MGKVITTVLYRRPQCEWTELSRMRISRFTSGLFLCSKPRAFQEKRRIFFCNNNGIIRKYCASPNSIYIWCMYTLP